MNGTTLTEMRDHIEALAGTDGDYYVVCGRTGERPVPVAGKRFADRATARRAARATEQYRSTLREYDPQLPRYDLIVCQETGPLTQTAGLGDPARGDDWTLSEPVLDGPSLDSNRRLANFCHRLVARLLEILADAGHRTARGALGDTYAEFTETTPDPRERCVRVLEHATDELDARLGGAEQADVLARVAARLPSPPEATDPVSATFERLQRVGLLDTYAVSPWSIDLDAGTRTVTVHFSGYALSPQDGRLPVFPVVVELARRRDDWPLPGVRVADVDGGWRVALSFGDDTVSNSPTNAAVRSEV
jgi:hypothetical protein